jgi:cytosine/adenosine deaminase-related metal-dependent hydrolase
MRALLLVPLVALLPLVLSPGCKKDDDPPVEADADTDTDTDADTDADTDTDTDADADTDTDTDADADADADVAVIETCTNTIPAPPAGELCGVTGDPATATHILIEGDVLGDTIAYEQGSILIERGVNGLIECVGCDCANQAPAETLTVSCPDGVVSPGLINAHDHIRYNLESPASVSDERYDHRHDWRTGARGHTSIPSSSDNSREAMMHGEIRMLLGGATSIAGSISSVNAQGLMRNLDGEEYTEGLGGGEVDYATFPLGDLDGTLAATGCGEYSIDGDFVLNNKIYLPHIAEGIDAEANNEFQCVTGAAGGEDLVADNTSIIHGIGLFPEDIEVMHDLGAHLVWSPRSNISLYGETASVGLYRAMGIPIALGTDWTLSGSATLLRELACADYLNEFHYNGRFSDRELWLMVTRSGAVSMGAEGQIGSLRPGLIADIAVFDGTSRDLHRAVIEADMGDVELVLRGSKPLTGDADLIAGLRTDSDTCDALDATSCAADNVVCVSEDAGITLSAIQASVGPSAYDLYICGTPADEPTCEPFRNNEDGDGIIYPTSSTTDFDGDGIDNAVDNCPDVFNPQRPLDGFVQADADADGIGDACDPCPLTTGQTCVWRDRDLDGVVDLDDNCPNADNANQLDTDGDYIGDACDACPNFQSFDGACPASVYDIKDGTVALGTDVILQDMQVTAVNEDGAYLQRVPGQTAFAGEDYSGIYVYMPGVEPKPGIGDRVDIGGSVDEFFSQIQLNGVTFLTVNSTGNDDPTPVSVLPAEVATGGTRAEQLEGVFVQLTDAEVTAVDLAPGPGDSAPTNEFEVGGSLRVNDEFYLVQPAPAVGETFAVLQGVLRFGNGDHKLEPRSAFDALAGNVVLSSLTPETVYIEAGTTTDALLAASLSNPTGVAQTVTIDCAPTANLTCPATLDFALGEQVQGIELTGVAASATPATVTATLGAVTLESDVVVYDDATVREVAALEPNPLSVSTGNEEELTVTLNVPGGAGGTDVTLSSSAGLTVPATVTVAEDQLSATFLVTAGATAGAETVTATLGASEITVDVNVSDAIVGTGPIITRYLEGSSGNNKFLEITNLLPSDFDLTGCEIEIYVNGNTSPNTEGLNTVTLGYGERFVICHSAADFSTGLPGGGCDQTWGSLSFNGDDAVALTCGGQPLDIIGQIGVDPGDRWEDATGDITTQNQNLIRACDISEGDTDGSDAFDPGVEWLDGGAGDNADLFGLERTCP